MKVTLSSSYSYKKVEFCCDEMGNFVMNQFLQSYPHSDHYPIFYVQVYKMNEGKKIYEHVTVRYCPFCGAKIEGSVEV